MESDLWSILPFETGSAPKIPDGPALPSQCMLFQFMQAAHSHQNAGNPVVIHPVFLIPLLAYA